MLLGRLGMAVGLILCASCGGGGGGHSRPAALSYTCADSAVGANVVALACAGQAVTDVWVIELDLGGPTTSHDIAGFNLDVLFDPTSVGYVGGSATVQGSFLAADGDTPLLSARIASNDPGRLIIGVRRTKSAGVQGSGGTNPILRFSLRANALVTFGPMQVKFENAEAVDSSDSPIGSVAFSEQLLLGVQ